MFRFDHLHGPVQALNPVRAPLCNTLPFNNLSQILVNIFVFMALKLVDNAKRNCCFEKITPHRRALFSFHFDVETTSSSNFHNSKENLLLS